MRGEPCRITVVYKIKEMQPTRHKAVVKQKVFALDPLPSQLGVKSESAHVTSTILKPKVSKPHIKSTVRILRQSSASSDKKSSVSENSAQESSIVRQLQCFSLRNEWEEQLAVEQALEAVRKQRVMEYLNQTQNEDAMVQFAIQQSLQTTTAPQPNSSSYQDPLMTYENLVLLEDVKVGCSKEQIESLSTSSLETSDAGNCVICMDSLIKGDAVAYFPVCQHIFHHSCIINWLKQSKKCCICKQEFISSS